MTAGAAVVVAAAVTIALVVTSTPATQPTTEAHVGATPTPTPVPVDMPVSVPAFGDIAHWAQAPTTTVARVLPQVGDAATGSVAAYIDAPVVDGQTIALETKAPVEAGEAYDFTVQLRALSALPAEVTATVMVGDTPVDVPELSAAWAEVSATVVAPADASEVSVRIVLDGPVSGLGVDDVSLVPAGGGDNLVPNPSFETVDADDVILNRSLILPADNPVLAVRLPKGTATWEASNDGGDVVAEGSADVLHDIDAIPLTGLDQGYYTITLGDSAGKSVSAKVGLIDFDGVSIAPDGRFGVGLHVEGPVYDDSADLASSLGLGLARNDILWKNNETTRGQYKFDSRYVNGFARLHAHGIKLLGIVNYGNWLYGSVLAPETPTAVAAYGKYAAAVAERFDLVGLEVFNEFNQERFNDTACGTHPRCYLPLLSVVEKEVRKVDADVPLIAGSTARYDADWFDGLWQGGGLQYADAISFHPYEVSSNPESLAGVIDRAVTSMQEHAGDVRPIWITELGTSSKTGGRSFTAQADYLVRTSITSFGKGVEKFFWYDLINDSPDPAEHEGNFGMYDQKKPGVAALQPKPVGYAQALMIAQLDGRAYLDSESVAEGVLSYRFGTEEESTRVVWAPKGPAEAVIPSSVPVTVVAMNGATTTVAPTEGVVRVSVSARPVFIRQADDAEGATPSAPADSQRTAP